MIYAFLFECPFRAQSDVHFRKEKIKTSKSCERNGKMANIDNRKKDHELVVLSAKIESLTQINKCLVEKIQVSACMVFRPYSLPSDSLWYPNDL